MLVTVELIKAGSKTQLLNTVIVLNEVVVVDLACAVSLHVLRGQESQVVITDVALDDSVALKSLSAQELLYSVNEIFDMHATCLLQVIVMEEMHDRWS